MAEVVGGASGDIVMLDRSSMSVSVATGEAVLRVFLVYGLGDGEDGTELVMARAWTVDGDTPVTEGLSVTLIGDVVAADDDVMPWPGRRLCLSVQVPRPVRGDLVLDVRVESTAAHSRHFRVPERALLGLEGQWLGMTTPAEQDGRYEKAFYLVRSNAQDFAVQRKVQERFAERPLFSVVVPLYHTPLDFFREMAQSVLRQTYPRLELILVNSTPEDAGLSQAVEDLAKTDGRVRVVTLDGNRGISENTNEGVKVAQGDFVCFFDHDDVLELDVLFWYVDGINRHPTTDLLYCDEDKLEDGSYVFPFFKSDWSPTHLESCNYVCHMLTVRRSLLLELPPNEQRHDGAQDHRISLLAGERARNVYHARRVLYHWRASSTSTANQVMAKPEALAAGRVALDEHYQRQGLPLVASELEGMPHYYEAHFAKGAAPSMTALVWGRFADANAQVLSQATGELSGLAVRRLDSLDDVPAALEDVRTKLVALVPEGVRLTSADFLGRLAVQAAKPTVGLAGARCQFPDGSKAGGALAFLECGPVPADYLMLPADPQIRGLERVAHEVDGLGVTALVARTTTIAQVGGVDPEMGDQQWALDLSCKMDAAGLSVVEVPLAHVERMMTPHELFVENDEERYQDQLYETRLRARWPQAFIVLDHHYSRSLSYHGYYELRA